MLLGLRLSRDCGRCSSPLGAGFACLVVVRLRCSAGVRREGERSRRGGWRMAGRRALPSGRLADVGRAGELGWRSRRGGHEMQK